MTTACAGLPSTPKAGLDPSSRRRRGDTHNRQQRAWDWPLHALTTYELAYYRRRLENAIAFLGKQDPVPAIRADIQAALDR
jgi:hypothetical protein